MRSKSILHVVSSPRLYASGMAQPCKYSDRQISQHLGYAKNFSVLNMRPPDTGGQHDIPISWHVGYGRIPTELPFPSNGRRGWGGGGAQCSLRDTRPLITPFYAKQASSCLSITIIKTGVDLVSSCSMKFTMHNYTLDFMVHMLGRKEIKSFTCLHIQYIAMRTHTLLIAFKISWRHLFFVKLSTDTVKPISEMWT